jgi:hypothetical protein
MARRHYKFINKNSNQMDKKVVIKKLSTHFNFANLRDAVMQLSPSPQTDEGLALMSATLNIPADAEYTWLSALAALYMHDNKMAARLIQTATFLRGKPAISGIAQNALLEMVKDACQLTKNEPFREVDGVVEDPKTKDQVIAELETWFTFPYLRVAITNLNNRSPKDEGIDILWAAVNVDPATDDIKVWFTALAIICVHNPLLAGRILELSTSEAGHPFMNMNKAELIDAIASGSKLTKADAG